MKDVMVLLSGGLDSTVLATIANRAGRLAVAAFVDYGQPAAAQEREAAQRWCGRNTSRLIELRAAFPAAIGLASGVGAPGPRVIPCRNLILISLAASSAPEVGAREVWYGATGADQASYPDCRPEFAAALSAVLALDGGVTVRAPLAGMLRPEVRALAVALQVAVADTWSCYQAREDGMPCGECDSCRQDR